MHQGPLVSGVHTRVKCASRSPNFRGPEEGKMCIKVPSFPEEGKMCIKVPSFQGLTIKV